MDSLSERGGPMSPNMTSAVLRHGTIEESDEARALRYGALRQEVITLFPRWMVPVEIASLVFLAFMWLRTGLPSLEAFVIFVVGPLPFVTLLLWVPLFGARSSRYYLRWDDQGIAVGRHWAVPHWLKRRVLGHSRSETCAQRRPRPNERIAGSLYPWGLFQGFRVVRDSLPEGLATFKVHFRNDSRGRLISRIYGRGPRLGLIASSGEIERFVESAQQYVPGGNLKPRSVL